MLQGVGAYILGYVSTAYAATTVATVESDINYWTSLYPGVTGIFFDEMTNTDNTTNITYYQTITRYAHAQGYYPVIGNPGAAVDTNYFQSGTADIICYNETQGYQTEATLNQAYVGGSGFNVPLSSKASIVYTVSYDPAQITLMKRWAKWIYVTDAAAANPYAALPTYLERLTRLCNNPSFGEFSLNDLFSDFLISGGVTATSTTLTGVMTPPSAYVTGIRTLIQSGAAQLTFTYAASSDTYNDLLDSGQIVHTAVANGATAPAVTPNSLRLEKVVTSATAITSVTPLATTVSTPTAQVATATGGTSAANMLPALNSSGVFNYSLLPPSVRAFAENTSTTTGLTWGYYGGTVENNGTPIVVADGTVALTASATNYVSVTQAGTVVVSTTGWTPGAFPLRTLVTGTTAITTDTDSRGSYTTTTTGSPYDFAGGIPGLPTASQVVARFVVGRAMTFPLNFSGSQWAAGTAPTAAASFSVNVNGTAIGAINFAASATTATFTTVSTGVTNVAAGAVLTIVAPATADTTLANVSGTLLGTLQ